MRIFCSQNLKGESGSMLYALLLSLLMASSVTYLLFTTSNSGEQVNKHIDKENAANNLFAVKKSITRILSNGDAINASRLSAANPNLDSCMTTPSGCPSGAQAFTLLTADGETYIGTASGDGIARVFDSTDNFFCNNFAADGSNPNCIYKYNLTWTGDSTTGNVIIKGQLQVASSSSLKINLEQFEINSVFVAPPPIVGGCNPAGAPYGGGDGSVGTPFLICDPGHIVNIGANAADWSKNFRLETDINMMGATPTRIGNIGTSQYFTGTFDGNNKTVDNLTWNAVGPYGLIAAASSTAVIKDLNFTNVNITGTGNFIGAALGTTAFPLAVDTVTISNVKVLSGSITMTTGQDVGGIAGEFSGTMSDSSANVAIVGNQGVAGGAIGRAYQATLTNVTTSGSLTGSFSSGGVVGSGYNLTATDITSSMNVRSTSAASQYLGGMVGYLNGKTNITNCSATGTVQSHFAANFQGVGGLVGYIYASSSTGVSTINNSFATGAVTANPAATGRSYGGLIGIAVSPTAADYITVVDSYATGGISSTSLSTHAGGERAASGGLIGNMTGKTQVSGTAPNKCYSSGTVSMRGGAVGGLVGYANGTGGGIISNCSSNATVVNPEATTVATLAFYGGLVGYSTVLNISGSSATGSVTALTGNIAGGLAGQVGGGGNINGSFATGAVRALRDTGGLIGVVASGASTFLLNNYATGNVTATDANSRAGGLAGTVANANIVDNYATGNVTGNARVGGLFGTATTSSNISGMGNCRYSIGTVTGTSQVGGFAGVFSGTSVNTCRVLATATINANGTRAGGFIGEALGGTITASVASGTANFTSGTFTAQMGGFVGYSQSTGYVNALSDGVINVSPTTPSQEYGGVFGALGTASSLSNIQYQGTLTVGGTFVVTYVGGIAGTAVLPYATMNIINMNGTIDNPKGDASGYFGYVTVSANNAVITFNNTTNNAGTITAQTPSGFIGQIYNSRSNVTLNFTGVTFSGSLTDSTPAGSSMPNFIGGLIGRIWSGGIGFVINITNSAVTANINKTVLTGTANSSIIGGLVSYVEDAAVAINISGSRYQGNITGADRSGGEGSIGGLVGRAGWSGTPTTTIQNSYSTGSINLYNFCASWMCGNKAGAGGLVGSTNTGRVIIARSYSTMNVNIVASNDNASAGGLVGVIRGPGSSITDSYSRGSVSNAMGFSGGLVGHVKNTGAAIPISNSYATGAVSGALSVGGLVGKGSDTVATTVTNSFFDFTVNSAWDGVGDNFDPAQNKTTAELQTAATFTGAGWSGATWNFTTPDLPPFFKLAWQP